MAFISWQNDLAHRYGGEKLSAEERDPDLAAAVEAARDAVFGAAPCLASVSDLRVENIKLEILDTSSSVQSSQDDEEEQNPLVDNHVHKECGSNHNEGKKTSIFISPFSFSVSE